VKFIIQKKGFCEISKQGHHLVNRIAGCYEMLTTDTERNESRFGISECHRIRSITEGRPAGTRAPSSSS